MISQSSTKRFWRYVDKTPGHGPNGDCWLWTGPMSRDYGRMGCDGKRRRATHISWEIATGQEFPEGAFGLHSCDNPPCVNGAHIFPGTNTDNAADKSAKGRHHMQNVSTCPSGHDLSGDNLLIDRRGHRRCRCCQQKHNRDYATRRRKQARAAIAALTPAPSPAQSTAADTPATPG